MTFPLETSISSLKVIVTDLPEVAIFNSLLLKKMDLIVDCCPPGKTLISSPGFIFPLAIIPQYPLKSKFGLFTHWTGILNGFELLSPIISTVSK